MSERVHRLIFFFKLQNMWRHYLRFDNSSKQESTPKLLEQLHSPKFCWKLSRQLRLGFAPRVRTRWTPGASPFVCAHRKSAKLTWRRFFTAVRISSQGSVSFLGCCWQHWRLAA